MLDNSECRVSAEIEGKFVVTIASDSEIKLSWRKNSTSIAQNILHGLALEQAFQMTGCTIN